MDASMPDGGRDAGPCPDLGEAYAIVEWTEITNEPACQYFSGPHGLGYEFSLGDLGHMTGTTTLVIDDATFTATDTGFTRNLECPFGSPDADHYRFTETLEGAWEGGFPSDPSCAATPPVFHGTYTYSECHVLMNRLCVDDGFPTCTITANVTITLVHDMPMPGTDAGTTDGGRSDDMAICTASCAARRTAAEGTTCVVPDDCEATCVAQFAPDQLCVPETRAFEECLGTMAGALECFDPDIVPTFMGPCDGANNAIFTCLTRPDPIGLCVAPVPDTGTVAEGDACTATSECVPGLFCDGPCDGSSGTCTTQPTREECFSMPRVTACTCGGVTSTTCLAAAFDMRVMGPGACPAVDGGVLPP